MNNMSVMRKWFVLLLLLCLALTGCSRRAVVEDLSQGEANHIVALLNGFGIHSFAERARGGRSKYSVEVKQSDYAEAVSLLAIHELPGEQRISFAELIEQQGFIPNSREIETLRLDHAMAVELEEALENHPAVVRARAVIRSHTASTPAEAGASIVIQRYEDRELAEEAIKELVVHSVPGLAREKVTISISPFKIREGRLQRVGVSGGTDVAVAIPLVPFLTWSIPEDDFSDVILTLLLLGASALVVGGVAGYMAGNRGAGPATQTGPRLPEAGPVSLELDSPGRDLPEIGS